MLNISFKGCIMSIESIKYSGNNLDSKDGILETCVVGYLSFGLITYLVSISI